MDIRLDKRRMLELESQILAMMGERFDGLPEQYTNFEPNYVGYHSRRFAVLLLVLESLGVKPTDRILDVGPTFTAILLNRHFGCAVDSLSFSPDTATPFGKNFQFDLNQSIHPEARRDDLPQYRFIVFTEVIEHLFTAPQHALRYLKDRCEPGGYIFCTTPNPLKLRKRVQMILGQNPQDWINEDPMRADHFREYTVEELRELGRQAGLETVFGEYMNLFNPTYRQKDFSISPTKGRLFFKLSEFVPRRLKPNSVAVYRRPSSQ